MITEQRIRNLEERVDCLEKQYQSWIKLMDGYAIAFKVLNERLHEISMLLNDEEVIGNDG